MTNSVEKCYSCGKPGKYTVMLAITGDRVYLPNQIVRECEPPHPGYGPESFCPTCMRAIEDSLRATILYLRSENNH
jgi:hypothetical protein